MLRYGEKEIKWNHIKCSIKTREGRKMGGRKKQRTNAMDRKLYNMADINTTI